VDVFALWAETRWSEIRRVRVPDDSSADIAGLRKGQSSALVHPEANEHILCIRSIIKESLLCRSLTSFWCLCSGRLALWVHLLRVALPAGRSLSPLIPTTMKRFFKIRKKTPKPLQKPSSSDPPTNLAAGSSNVRTDQNVGPKGRFSRRTLHSKVD
jgi:hypothetical protein